MYRHFRLARAPPSPLRVTCGNQSTLLAVGSGVHILTALPPNASCTIRIQCHSMPERELSFLALPSSLQVSQRHDLCDIARTENVQELDIDGRSDLGELPVCKQNVETSHERRPLAPRRRMVFVPTFIALGILIAVHLVLVILIHAC